MYRLISLVLIIGFTFTACYQGGEDIAFHVPDPEKIPPNLKTPVRVALYVDTAGPDARAELAAAARYSILPAPNKAKESSRVAYFDYVILSGGEMKHGKVSAYVELNAPLKELLADYNNLIKPLRDRGIKVLLGISGGGGISFGCLPGEWKEGKELPASEFNDGDDVLANINKIFKERAKNKSIFAQRAFANQVVDACKYYRLDGVEFWDKDGATPKQNPYPEVGVHFFNGEKTVYIENERDSVYRWVMGGGNVVDMLTYIMELFGAASTFQGDHGFDQKMLTPVLVRETGYGRWFPEQVPRYDFTTTMTALTYLVGNSEDEFGWENTEEPIDLMNWVTAESYSPIIIDLVNISDSKLKEYSVKLGGRERENGTIISYASRYGLIYYSNIGSHTTGQEERFSVTSQEVFNADVEYD